MRFIAIEPEQLAAKINISQAELEAAPTTSFWTTLQSSRKRVQISANSFQDHRQNRCGNGHELRKKAADVDAQAKKGAKFDDLAKKYSEDASTER